MDYPKLESYFSSLEGLPSVVQKQHIPLPPELLQEFQSKYAVPNIIMLHGYNLILMILSLSN